MTVFETFPSIGENIVMKYKTWNSKNLDNTRLIRSYVSFAISERERETERRRKKVSDREREREVFTWALTEPWSLSCSFLRSGRDRLTTSLMSTTLLCISSMATSIGCRTESVFFTTSILFFMYGKLWEAAKSKTLACQVFHSLSVYQTFNSQHRYGIWVILSLSNFFNLESVINSLELEYLKCKKITMSFIS